MKRGAVALLAFTLAVVLFHLATRPVPVSVKVNAGLEEEAKRLVEEMPK